MTLSVLDKTINRVICSGVNSLLTSFVICSTLAILCTFDFVYSDDKCTVAHTAYRSPACVCCPESAGRVCSKLCLLLIARRQLHQHAVY